MSPTKSKVQVLVGYCIGVVLSVPPLSHVWPALGTLAERLVRWTWSSLTHAVDMLPWDQASASSPIPPIHYVSLCVLALAALAPAVLCATARTVIQEGAWLKSLGQSVAFVLVPMALLSFLFLPASLAALLVGLSVLVSAVVAIEPSSKAGAVMWALQGIVSIQVVRMVIAGPSEDFQKAFENHTGFGGDISLGTSTLSLDIQMWAILAAGGALVVWQSVKSAWAVLKPPPRSRGASGFPGMDPFSP